MLSLLSLTGWVSLLVLIYKLVYLARNIRRAKSTNIPYTISPINEYEVWAYMTDPILRWAFKSYLMQKKGWPRWARFMVKDWMYEDKGRAHREFGDVFSVVSPGGILCYVGNPQSALFVATQRKSFIKPYEKMSTYSCNWLPSSLYSFLKFVEMLEPFGPNVVTAEGEIWRFHLRITLPPFNESINHVVWSETFRQTEILISAWTDQSLKKGINKMAVNVLSCVGFSQPAQKIGDMDAIPAGHKISFVNAIATVVANLPPILVLHPSILKYSPWAFAHRAYVEFDNYMHELLAKEKASMSSKGTESGKDNLMRALLKSNASNKKSRLAGPGGRTGLTDGEILGNVFIFVVAGTWASPGCSLHCNIPSDVLTDRSQVRNHQRIQCYLPLSFLRSIPRFRIVWLPILRWSLEKPYSRAEQNSLTRRTYPNSVTLLHLWYV